MKAIITGMNGTVAPVVAKKFKQHGVEIIPWDRSIVPIDNEEKMIEFITSVNPNLLLHIGMGSVETTEFLAKLCLEQNRTFVFTSTVSVFSENGSGPYDVSSKPNAEDDYGRYKRNCEEAIKRVNPNAFIVRLGWQIGHTAGSNNMVDFLERSMREKGYIEASDQWYPSCSLLEDTAVALYSIYNTLKPGLYLINSNQNSTFFDIVNGLNNEQRDWNVVRGTNPSRDDRMFDNRVSIPTIESRLNLN